MHIPSLTLGWELEVENLSYDDGEALDIAQDFASLRLGRALRDVKEDCSLEEGGAEIVSQPRTLDEWRALTPNVNGLLDDLSRDGWRSWDGGNCGFHIHVGRDELSADGLVRLMTLIYQPENVRFWKRLSGRRDFEWCPFDVLLSDVQRHARDCKSHVDWYSHHRSAVHMSSHGTVEFRLWRGSLNKERIWRNIEATHAACSFAELFDDSEMTADDFQQYVLTNDAIYPMLAASFASTLSTTGV